MAVSAKKAEPSSGNASPLCLSAVTSEISLLCCLDDQLSDLLRKGQHRDVAGRHFDRCGICRLDLILFHLGRNDRILRRYDYEGLILAPCDLAHGSGPSPGVERSLRRRHDGLFLGCVGGGGVFPYALGADSEVV